MAEDESSFDGAIGGVETCRKLSAAFYARVDRDPLLRPLFPGTTLRCATEEFTAFLVQFLGGPAEHTQKRWWVSLRQSHLRVKIGPGHRDAWIKCMNQAFDDVPIGEPARTSLRQFFEHSSAYVVNQGQAPAVREPIEELAPQWNRQRTLDESVAAIRSGDSARAIELAEQASVNTGILALMIGSGDETMLRYVREKLEGEPALVHARYGGRTLLHEASAHGNAPLVELMLGLGADPNVTTAGGHPPLYCLANECKTAHGAKVVRVLVNAGAHVDASDGVKRCTPLHMAARRGNADIAEALLDCGADIEARDIAGDTPLRRAANVDKVAVATLLLAKGADKHSVGSKGLAPSHAARSDVMKRLLSSKAL